MALGNETEVFYGVLTGSVAAAAATGSQVLVGSNPGRKALWIYNDSTETAYVSFLGPAGPSDFSFKIAADSFFEVPKPMPSGSVNIAHDGAVGSVHFTDIS